MAGDHAATLLLPHMATAVTLEKGQMSSLSCCSQTLALRLGMQTENKAWPALVLSLSCPQAANDPGGLCNLCGS